MGKALWERRWKEATFPGKWDNCGNGQNSTTQDREEGSRSSWHVLRLVGVGERWKPGAHRLGGFHGGKFIQGGVTLDPVGSKHLGASRYLPLESQSPIWHIYELKLPCAEEEVSGNKDSFLPGQFFQTTFSLLSIFWWYFHLPRICSHLPLQPLC